MSVLSFYTTFITSISLFSFLVNSTKLIVLCSLMFAITISLCNLASYYKGITKSIVVLMGGVAVAGLLHGTNLYILNGKVIGGLVFASSASIVAAGLLSLLVFSRLSKVISVFASSLLSLILASLVDLLFMFLFFSQKQIFETSELLAMFQRQLIYKLLYSLIFSLVTACLTRIKSFILVRNKDFVNSGKFSSRLENLQ